MNKKDIDEIIGQIKNAFATHEACAIIHVEPFAQLLMDKPDEAINHIFDIYDSKNKIIPTPVKEGLACT